MWIRLLVVAALLSAVRSEDWHGFDGYEEETEEHQPRSIILRNLSGRRVELYWVDEFSSERSLMSDPDILHGAEFDINSYAWHHFEIKELPSKRTGGCLVDGCSTAAFTVNDNEHQVISLDGNFTVRHDDHRTIAFAKATDLMTECKNTAMQQMQKVQDKKAVLTEMTECMQESMEHEMQDLQEDLDSQKDILSIMSHAYERHTCADNSLSTSPSKRNVTWYDGRVGQKHLVQILHERAESNIHVVEDFISEEQCNAMEEAAKDNLEQATIADGQGGSVVDTSRKALQAGISVPWYLEEEGDPIAKISRKVYDYVNHVLDLDIDEEGQEDLMSIQYTGRGVNDPEPDQYQPHCDGDCDGYAHKHGARVATMVMYCTVPAKGGATNFRHAGLHVVPKKGRAVFFSYIDPVTMNMDDGFTLHSGCPVVEGEKKIVTQWVRYGVTHEVPWDRYNSMDELIDEEDMDEYWRVEEEEKVNHYL